MSNYDHYMMIHQRDGLHWYTHPTQVSFWYRFSDCRFMIGPNISKNPTMLPLNWDAAHP